MSQPQSSATNQLMRLLAKVERDSDLKNVKIINHAGMRIASSASDHTDAEDDVASSNALIMLGNNFLKEIDHGEIREVILRAEQGYVIVQYITEDYMVYAMLDNLMRVGYYISYLRNICKKFAYILSGNVVTDELLKEIEAEKERESKSRTLDFKEKLEIKKDLNEDKRALEDLLSVLSEGVAEDTTLGAASNKRGEAGVVGIDNDIMFDLEKMLEPASISQDAINKARMKAKEMAEQGLIKTEEKERTYDSGDGTIASDLEDFFSGLEEVQKPQAEPASAKPEEIKLPEEDLLSSLNLEEVATKFVEIQKTESTAEIKTQPTVAAKPEPNPEPKKAEPVPTTTKQVEPEIEMQSTPTATTEEPVVHHAETKLKPEDYIAVYGIPIYEDEVPPRELEDVVEFQLRTEQEEEIIRQAYPAQIPEVPLDEFGNPIFDDFAADEYADYELEEDEMIDAMSKKRK